VTTDIKQTSGHNEKRISHCFYNPCENDRIFIYDCCSFGRQIERISIKSTKGESKGRTVGSILSLSLSPAFTEPESSDNNFTHKSL
jgi:hypothetical protein